METKLTEKQKRRLWFKVFHSLMNRYCSSCKTYFKCNGSCGSDRRFSVINFCFCPHCYVIAFPTYKNFDDRRKKCDILNKYRKENP